MAYSLRSPMGISWTCIRTAATHPAIMDTGKAKRELDWKPKYTGIEALRATLRREPS